MQTPEFRWPSHATIPGSPITYALLLADNQEDGLPPSRGDVICWVFQYPTEALAYLKNPFTGSRDYRIFVCAEQAREELSQFGELALLRMDP